MSYWIEDHLGWISVISIVLLFGLLVWASKKQTEAIDQECASMLTLARTPRDTLDVRIACNKMHDDAAMRAAVIAAGSLAASRR